MIRKFQKAIEKIRKISYTIYKEKTINDSGGIDMCKALKIICGITLSVAFAYGVFKVVYLIISQKKDYFEAPL